MANYSTFPNAIDVFTMKTEITYSDLPSIQRFQELKLKQNRTPSEESELANLTTQLRSKLIAADEWNKFQDALVNMEIFIKDGIEGYIEDKQTEFNNYLDSRKNEINSTKDAALIQIEQKKENIIEYLDSTTAGELRNDIGVMGDLETTNKNSLVEAVNEVNGKVNQVRTDSTQAFCLETRTDDPVNPAVGRMWIRTDL